MENPSEILQSPKQQSPIANTFTKNVRRQFTLKHQHSYSEKLWENRHYCTYLSQLIIIFNALIRHAKLQYLDRYDIVEDNGRRILTYTKYLM